MSKCRGCGADIEWVKTRTGKNMPVDAIPNPLWAPCLGTTMVIRVHGKNAEVITVPIDGSVVVEAWRPHWATCPKSDDFRKKKGDRR